MFNLFKKNPKPPPFQPERDWRWLLAGALVCVIILLAIYTWLNYKLNNYPDNFLNNSNNNLENSLTSASSTLPKLNRTELEKYSAEIIGRQTNLETLLKAPEKVTDPSL